VIFDGNNVDAAVFSEYPNEHAKLAAGLRWRFRWVGVLNVLLSPGILLVRLAYFIFHNSDSLRKSAGPLAARQWSPYACYLLRNYSEVEHVFRQRLGRTLPPANKYVDLFVSPSVTIGARFVVFVVGGLFVALTTLGFVYDEDFLFANLVGGRSVIWWTGILGLVLAASQAAIPKEDSRPDFKETLTEVMAESGYAPDEWHGEEDNLDTFDGFTALFQLKGVTFFEELVSILFLTPYILIFRMPRECDYIVAFFKGRTYRHPHLGDFCKYACFHPPTSSETEHSVGPATESGTAASYWGERSHHAEVSFTRESYVNRLDHSIATFKREHPNWRPETRADIMHMSASCSERPDEGSIIEEGQFQLPSNKLNVHPDDIGESHM
jgi:autophagy-related protein 9